MTKHVTATAAHKEFTPLSAKLLVFSCLLAQVFGNGMTSIYGLFVTPIATEFDANMSTMSMGMAIFLFTSALCSVWLGLKLNNSNIRRCMLTGAILLGIGFGLFSRSSSLSSIAASLVLISIAISMYTMLPGNILIASRFNTFRGRALAIAATGISVAGFILPPAAAWLLASLSWRDAIGIIGITASVLLFLTFYFGIAAPETTRPGSTSKNYESEKQNSNTEEVALNTKALFGDQGFWYIVLIFSLFYSVSIIIAVHNVPYFLSLDLTTSDAAWMIVLGSIAGLAGKIIYGSLVDWYPQHLLLLFLSLQLLPVGLWCIQANILEYSDFIYPVIISITFFVGGTLPMQPYL